MGLQQLQQRGDVEMAQADCVGEALIERRAAVLQQRLHLGVQGAEHDQSTSGLWRGGQPVHLRLQLGGEWIEGLAAEGLELIEGHDPALGAELADAHRQGAQVVGQGGAHTEVLHEVAGGADHAGWIGVRDMDVKHPLAAFGLQQLLHQPRA